MRLFWGGLQWLLPKLGTSSVSVVGTLSSERRCVAVPGSCAAAVNNSSALLVQILPEDTIPKEIHSETEDRYERRGEELTRAGVKFEQTTSHLLATEDELMNVCDTVLGSCRGKVLVVDISCFPKRFFCFMIKQFLLSPHVHNLVVAYTETGFDGYARGPLSYSPLPPDYIPGFPFVPPDERKSRLVVTLGFEPLGLRHLVRKWADEEAPAFILSTSSDSDVLRRLWDTAREIVEGKGMLLDDVRFYSSRDVDGVFKHLVRETDRTEVVTIAPYGAKLHTLAAALYCMTRPDTAGMVYTQPQWYNPDYSIGIGDSWGYVVKWQGVSCLNRLPLEF